MMISISTAITNFFSHTTTQTKKRNVYLVYLFIFLLAFLPACTDKELYVQTEVLSLRTGPSESKEVAGRLRINTKVDVLEKRKGWVKVAMAGFDRDGWAPRSQFARKPLTLDEAVKKAQSAEGAEKIAWLERAVAIGSRKEDWLSLLAAYQKAGLKDKSKNVRDFLDGRLPVYIGVCASDQALLLGVYTADSGFKELINRYPSEESELEGLIGTLANATWYSSRVGTIEGTPFPEPRIDSIDPLVHIVLGRCSSYGTIFATAPIDSYSPYTVEDIAVEQAIRAMLQDKTSAREFTSLTIEHFSESPVLYEVNFEGEDKSKDTWLGWMLLDDKYQPLLSCEQDYYKSFFPQVQQGCKDVPGLTCSVVIEDSSWWTFQFGLPVRFVVKGWSRGGTQEIEDKSGRVVDTISGSIGGYWFALVKEAGCAYMSSITTGGEGL